jgi:hypothetical protein
MRTSPTAVPVGIGRVNPFPLVFVIVVVDDAERNAGPLATGGV